MTAKRNFQVTFWEHSQFVATVRAENQHEAMSIGQFRYGAARPAACEGFTLVETLDTEWDAVQLPPRCRKPRSS